MNTIEIKTDLSGEELQVLIWELEAFCEKNRLPKPVLQQCNVSGRSEQLFCEVYSCSNAATHQKDGLWFCDQHPRQAK